ncbi:MAG: glycosyltransferase family 2 protein [Myxococcales bacterium]
MARKDTAPRPAVSVLILTLDEEACLPFALRSVAWCDDIVIVDSGSRDRTVEIAKEAGARIFTHPFEDYSKQRNWSIHEVQFKHPWVFILDADEEIPPSLRDELAAVAHPEATEAAFRVRFRVYFMGRWIKHASQYPVWVIRLIRPGKVAYDERVVNEHPIADGPVGALQNDLLHIDRRGLARHFHKQNVYSSLEAVEYARHELSARRLSALLSRNPMARRKALKELSIHLPGRTLLKFLYCYLLKGGIIDGIPGLHWSILNGVQEYMTSLKVAERQGALAQMMGSADAAHDRIPPDEAL